MTLPRQKMTPLRQQMLNDMRLERLAPRTQESYIAAIAGLAKYYKLSPDKLDKEKVNAYLLYLLEERHLAWSSCNLVVCALKFFYTKTLGWESISIPLPPRKTKHMLPEIFSAEELERLFACAGPNIKHRLLLMTTYSGGLRVSEVVRLKVTDIDSARMTIRIEQGKGNKDRYTILSTRLLKELRYYWLMYRPSVWLFPGSGPKQFIDITTAQKVYNYAKDRAGLKKGRGIHTLRHCFATHMLEAGVDPRTIQMLMGHSSITTTMGYMQVTRKKLNAIRSPLDLLDIPILKKPE